MSSQDHPAVTVLLSPDDRCAPAWAGLGALVAPGELASLAADAVVLRPQPGALPGPGLLARLLAAHTPEHPVVARSVPLETDGACVLGTAAQLRDALEPVLAPTAVVHLDVRAEPSGDRATPRPTGRQLLEGDGCFLSVVMRTQGTRPQCLEEALLSLAGQTLRSFEVVLAGHRLAPGARSLVDAVVAAQPEWLRDRVRVVPVEHGGRSAPLNVGLAEARGEYVAVLDDDDVVLAHWVETFRDLAAGAPGRTLRAAAMQQQVEATDDAGRAWPRPVAPLLLPWPLDFHLVDHLVANRTPVMAVAYPTAAVREHGLGFDEALSTTEDWDFLVRAVAVTGVAASPEITSVYRWWMDAGSSRHEHAESDWDANHERVVAGFDELGLRLPPGGVRRLQELDEQRRHELAAVEADRDARVAALQEQVHKLTRRVKKLRAAADEAPDRGGRRGGGFLRRRPD